MAARAAAPLARSTRPTQRTKGWSGSSPRARRAAADGLGALASRVEPQFPASLLDEATAALLVALKDEVEDVRIDAEQALCAVNIRAARAAGLEQDEADQGKRAGDGVP